MGTFDTIEVPCPACGTPSDFQSKGGACVCAVYRLDDAPADVLSDVNRHAPNTCRRCGAAFLVAVTPHAEAVQVGTDGKPLPLAAAPVPPAAFVPHHWFSQAFIDVGAERYQMVAATGFSPEHDDGYDAWELVRAAIHYAAASQRWRADLLPAGARPLPENLIRSGTDEHRKAIQSMPPYGFGKNSAFSWPWPLDAFQPRSAREDLVRAAALLVREIERLDRHAASEKEGSQP